MNLSPLLSAHSDVLLEVGSFLTPTDLHRLAASSIELHVTLSTSWSSQSASEDHLSSEESLLSEIVRTYGVEGLCSSLRVSEIPFDVESILALVARRELTADLFYTLLIYHRHVLIDWKDDRTGCSLLHFFCRYGGWRLIYLYARFGGDVDVPMEAQQSGTLLTTFADPHENMPPIVSVPTSFIPVPLVMLGKSPLLHALRYYNIKEAEALVELGADVSVTDEEKRVPLTIAFRYSIRSPKLIIGLAHPKVLGRKDIYGWTPLHYAAFYDCHQQLSLILPIIGRDALKCVNNDGLTPIELAIREGNNRCVELLDLWEKSIPIACENRIGLGQGFPPRGEMVAICIECILREELATIRKRLTISEEENNSIKKKVTALEVERMCYELILDEQYLSDGRNPASLVPQSAYSDTVSREREKSAATIDQLRELLCHRDEDSQSNVSPTPLSMEASGDEHMVLERTSVSLQYYQAEKLEHSRRSEAALLVLQSKDEMISKLKEEKDALVAEKANLEEDKKAAAERESALQTRFECLLTECAKLQCEVHRLQELNDAAATEFEALRRADGAARLQIEKLKKSLVENENEKKSLQEEIAQMKRITAVKSVQTEGRSVEEKLINENSKLKSEIQKLNEEVNKMKRDLAEKESELEARVNKVKKASPPRTTVEEKTLKDLEARLSELTLENQRCRFAEKEAIRQKAAAVEELEAIQARHHPLQSTVMCQTPEEFQLTWPLKEFIRGLDRVESSTLVVELRKQLHDAEQARYELLVLSQADHRKLSDQVRYAEEETARLEILCEERKASIGELRETCERLEKDSRARAAEKERVVGRLQQVLEEWTNAQNKWDEEKAFLETKLSECELNSEHMRTELDEVRASFSAVKAFSQPSVALTDHDECSTATRIRQLTSKVLSLTRLEYEGRLRAQRLTVQYELTERKARRLQESLDRLTSLLSQSESKHAALESRLSDKRREACLAEGNEETVALKETNERLNARISEMHRLHKGQVERLMKQVSSTDDMLKQITQSIGKFTPPLGLEEVLERCRGSDHEVDLAELLLATAERLWREEGKTQRLQAAIERWWRNWRHSEEALVSLAQTAPSNSATPLRPCWKRLSDVNQSLQSALKRSLQGWQEARIELMVLQQAGSSKKTTCENEGNPCVSERDSEPVSPGITIDKGSEEAAYKAAIKDITSRLIGYSTQIDVLKLENIQLRSQLGRRDSIDGRMEGSGDDVILKDVMEKVAAIEAKLSSFTIEGAQDATGVLLPVDSILKPQNFMTDDDFEEIILARIDEECRSLKVRHAEEVASVRLALERDVQDMKAKLEADREVFTATIEGHAAETSRLRLQLDQLRKRLALCTAATKGSGESDALVALSSVCAELARFERNDKESLERDDSSSGESAKNEKMKRIIAAQRQVILSLQGSSAPATGGSTEDALLNALNKIQEKVDSLHLASTKKKQSGTFNSADLRLLVVACETMAKEIGKKAPGDKHRCIPERHVEDDKKRRLGDAEIERIVEARVQEHVHRYNGLLKRVEVMAEQQKNMHRRYKNVSEQLSNARMKLSDTKEEKAKAGNIDIIKVEDAWSQTSEASTTDGIVQTEAPVRMQDGCCQVSVENDSKATQSQRPPCLAPFTGIASWSSVKGNPPECLVCPEIKNENLKLQELLGEHDRMLADTRMKGKNMQETIQRLKGKIEELKKSLAAAETRLRQSNKAVQTTRGSARLSSSVNLEDRWMTDRLVVALGKAEKMTENLVRSQSSSPPRKRTAPVNWQTQPVRAKSPVPKHLETLKTLREEAASLRAKAEQLEKELGNSREDARLVRLDMSRKLASANAEFRKLNQTIESERSSKAALMAEMNETVDELRHTKQKINHQEAKIRALREELKTAREYAKEKENAITNEEVANTARKKEAEDELTGKLKACQKELRSREAVMSDLRKEMSAKKCLLVEAEAKVADLDVRLRTLKADLQRQSKLTEQLKKKSVENQEAIQAAVRGEAEAKDKEGRARNEVERLKRQLDVTKMKLEETRAKVDDLKQEAARAEPAMLFHARQDTSHATYGVANRLKHSRDRKNGAGATVSSRTRVDRDTVSVEGDASELSSVIELSDGHSLSERPSGVEDSDLHMITLASLDSRQEENAKASSDDGNLSLNRAIRESLALLELTPEEAAEFLRPLNSSIS